MHAAATLLMPGCAIASTAARPDGDVSAREVFARFVDLLYRRRQARAAFESCVVARGFVDHVEGAAGSRAGVMARLGEDFARDEVVLEVLHTAFERDIGIVHVRLQPRDGSAARSRVDIFRLAAGRIVEHWEVAP